MTSRIFTKLIVAILCMLVVALVAVDLLVSGIAESNYRATLASELTAKARMLSLCDPDEAAKLARSGKLRLTIVGAGGEVLADSEADSQRMENHRGRPEVAAALAGREGTSIRLSPTLGIDFLYVAVPRPGGALRLARPLAGISAQVNSLRVQILKAAAIAMLPAILLAALLARSVSGRLGRIIEFAAKLAKGDFTAKLPSMGRDELGILGARIGQTAAHLKTIVEELSTERKEMEKLERVRKDFVINVSHELRTPLASIQGYTETLLNGALHDGENNVRFLNIIRQNSERLGRLISDLMTISSLELRTQKFHFAFYRLDFLLADAVDSMLPVADKKRILLTVDPPPASTEAFCDSEAVHQMLINLLDNAVKYTPEGGTITVGARTVAAFVEIYVRDTGIGIPDDDLPRLFERFYRVDKARSRELGGTGLGLAIVKHVARAQGGEVKVESQLGQGSTFSFTLPVNDLGLSEYAGGQPKLTIP